MNREQRRRRHRAHKARTKARAAKRRAIARAWQQPWFDHVEEQEVVYRSRCVGGRLNGKEVPRGQATVECYKELEFDVWEPATKQVVEFLRYKKLRVWFTEEVERRSRPQVHSIMVGVEHKAWIQTTTRKFLGKMDLWLAPGEDEKAAVKHWGNALGDMVRMCARLYRQGDPGYDAQA